MNICKKCISVTLAILFILTVMLVGIVPATVRTQAASWNGYNNGGGTLYGSQSFLEAFGINYDTYMKWMDDHDKDSANPNYYLGTPYAHNDHRNPRGDCAGARGAYDSPGVAAMNCTGFVWHVLYKSAVNSGAPSYKINRLSVMGGVPASWVNYDINRIWFDSVDDAYKSGVLEKGDLMWLYGTSDNHNAIFYGDSPEDFIYWDSAGKNNRYATVHAIGQSRGLWVAKVTQPNNIELHMDTATTDGMLFGTKYCIFNSKAKAQAVIDDPSDDAAWEKREGTIVLNSKGHGVLRTQSAPAAKDLWIDGSPNTGHSYFSAAAKRVSSKNTYYAVQWSHADGIQKDTQIHEFKDSGSRTGTGYRIFKCYAPVKVEAPSITAMKSISDGIRISISPVKGASKYRIYYMNSNGNWVKMADSSSATYVDKNVKADTTYRYTVRCMDKYDNLISDYDTEGWSHTYTTLATPEITDLKTTADGVQLSWDAVEGSEYYRAYYKNSKGGWTKMTETSDTAFTDMEVSPGSTYTYTVRCVDSEGDFVSDYDKTGWKHTFEGVETPQMESVVSEPEGVRMTWTPIEGVAKYRVYYKNKNNNWVRMTETAETEYLDWQVSPGTTYTYNVRCVNDKGYFVSNQSKDGWKCTYKGVDTIPTLTVKSETDGVRLSWEPVEGAAKYRVYYKNKNGNWVRMEETAGTDYLDTDVGIGKTYTYNIRCVNSMGYFSSGQDKNGWKGTYLGGATPQITSMTSEADGVHISWDPVEGASKYRVYYKSKNGEWKQFAETSDTNCVDDVVALNTSYTYTVRCVNPLGKFASGFNEKGWTYKYTGVSAPAAPVLENTADGVHISWNAVEGTAQYRIYYLGGNGAWKALDTTDGTELLDTDVEEGYHYTYTVRCIGPRGNLVSDYAPASKIQYAVPTESE